MKALARYLDGLLDLVVGLLVWVSAAVGFLLALWLVLLTIVALARMVSP